MLSSRVFQQQYVCMRGDIHYEVTQALQPCWVYQTREGCPIACLLVLSQNEVKATQRDTNQGWAEIMLDGAENIQLRMVCVNLLFDCDLRFHASLPNGKSMENSVRAGGALGIPINFALVRAFVLQIFLDDNNPLVDKDAEWVFNSNGVICRPRYINSFMPNSNVRHAPMELVGSGGPIGDAPFLGSDLFENDDEEADDQPSSHYNNTSPLQVRISVDTAFFERRTNDGDDTPTRVEMLEAGAKKMIALMMND